MASPIRTRTLPQCSACLRTYAWSPFMSLNSTTNTSLRQQIRGKRKMPNNSATVAVRLQRDVKAFGKKGSFVPVERGRMRNQFFPQGIARYVTVPELKVIRTNGIQIERDFTFGVAEDAIARNMDSASGDDESADVSTTAKSGLRVERVSSERSVELFNIFVRPYLDFYRQPIPEEEAEESIKPEDKTRSASSAAADLLAARAHAAKLRSALAKPRTIYGSVSTHDVLVAVRAALMTNEEASRVTLTEDDFEFVELPAQGDSEPSKVKQIGEFKLQIRIKGAEAVLHRTVRVIPQEV